MVDNQIPEMKLLSDIIKDGTLVDNHEYAVKDDEFTVIKGKYKEPQKLLKEDSEPVYKFLTQINNINVDKNTVILIKDEEYEHNTNDRLINVRGTDPWNFTLTTGNLIGFVTYGTYSLKISSRFGDPFLCYIIADADGFLELKDIGSASDEGNFERLLASLWNIKLKRAYRRGLPKAYKTKNERTSRVRGTIDVIDYFQNKVPGKYLCSYREHSYDNPAMSLFIKAYEAVKHYSFCQDTRNIYNALLVANQGVKRTRQEILNTQHFTNPFYNDYNVLIDLSKHIIRQQGASIDIQDESNAFLFDVSMLFEYFIRKLIKRESDLDLWRKKKQPIQNTKG